MPRNPTHKTYAARQLRLRREALSATEGHRITQEQMAARTGYALTQIAISRLELGVINPDELSVPRLNALARALCWTPWELQQATGVDLGILPEGVAWRPFPIGHARTRYSGTAA